MSGEILGVLKILKDPVGVGRSTKTNKEKGFENEKLLLKMVGQKDTRKRILKRVEGRITEIGVRNCQPIFPIQLGHTGGKANI